MKKMFVKCSLAAALSALMVGCQTERYETNSTLAAFVDRETVKDMDDEDIVAQNVSVQDLEKTDKVKIGILVSVSDQSLGVAKIPDFPLIEGTVKRLVHNYASRSLKSYDCVLLQNKAEAETCPFIVEMAFQLNSEIEQTFDFDEIMYKASLDWKLIDNRTKINKLGKHDAPFVRESLTCKNLGVREANLTSLTGMRMAGADLTNAQNAFATAVENCLIEFRAQLTSRLPFGGRITSMYMKDGELCFAMRGGSQDGVLPGMQMLVLNEDGDQVCVAQYAGDKDDVSRFQVWRWLSDSLKKEVLLYAADRGKAETWLKDSPFYAISLGMPTQKYERTVIRDKETSDRLKKRELKLF